MAECVNLSVGEIDFEHNMKENLSDTTLIPCSICQRTFKSESLQKHQAVCQKNATKKRRVFDSMKQRIQGTELAEYISLPVIPPKAKLIPINKVGTDKTVRDYHGTGESLKVGHDVSPACSSVKVQFSTRSRTLGSQGPSKVGSLKEEKCPHCERTFNWKAFSRHEEWCKEHKSRTAQAQSPASVVKAKEMLDARIKYRARVLGKGKRPTNREKYAGGISVSSGIESSIVNSEDIPRSSHVTPKTPAASGNIGNKRRVLASKVSTVNMSAVRGAADHTVPSSMVQSTRRGLLPSKKTSSVIVNPSENGNDGVGDGQHLAKNSPNQSMYDPFCKAEMQLKELLSDGVGINKPVKESSPEMQLSENGVLGRTECAKKNDNSCEILEVYSNQKEAKEVELPDVLTETSTHLSFEMPIVVRGRDGLTSTKRRAMKLTPQNMGIELNPVQPNAGKRSSLTLEIDCGNQDCENISSVMDMGFIIPQNKNTKLNPSQELHIDNIQKSINCVTLGLANLSANSRESLIDIDNNNYMLEMSIRAGMEKSPVNPSRELLELEESDWTVVGPRAMHQGSLCSSDDSGKRVSRLRELEGDYEEGSSSPDSLVAVNPLVSVKPLVDSAYSSLSRPTLPTIKYHEEAANKPSIHPTFPGGDHDNDHADKWLEDDLVSRKTLGHNRQDVDEPLQDFKLAKFCHDCGSRYPLTEAKFCCVCGARRLAV